MKFCYSVKSSSFFSVKFRYITTNSPSRVMYLSACYGIKNSIVEKIFSLFCKNSLLIISPYSLLCNRWSQIANTVLSVWRFLNFLCHSRKCGNISKPSTYTFVTWLWLELRQTLHKTGPQYEILLHHIFEVKLSFSFDLFP